MNVMRNLEFALETGTPTRMGNVSLEGAYA